MCVCVCACVCIYACVCICMYVRVFCFDKDIMCLSKECFLMFSPSDHCSQKIFSICG